MISYKIHNPHGYRAEDPRFGLSGEELKNYYLSQPTQFYVKCIYKQESKNSLTQASSAHELNIKLLLNDIQFVGPLLSEDNDTEIGMMYIMNMPNRNSVEAFLKKDECYKLGLIEKIEIYRFINSKKHRFGDRSPDTQMQLFVCECLDKKNLSDLRSKTSEAPHNYQGQIINNYFAHGPLRSDDGVNLIGSLFIIEVENMKAAKKLVASEPFTKAGVFKTTTITGWRYSHFLKS